MTQPTDAQREAAAKVIVDYMWGIGIVLPLPRTDARELAERALTAAAEVVRDEYQVCERCKLWVHKPLVHPKLKASANHGLRTR